MLELLDRLVEEGNNDIHCPIEHSPVRKMFAWAVLRDILPVVVCRRQAAYRRAVA